MPTEAEDRRTFQLELYKCLRAEVIAQGAKYDQLKVWLLAGLGAYYAWIIANIFGTTTSSICAKLNDMTITTLVLIPVGIAFMTTMSAGYFAVYFDNVAAYFRDVENAAGLPGLGWQSRHGIPDAFRYWSGFRALTDPFFAVILVSVSLVSLVIYVDTRDVRLCPAAPVAVVPVPAAAPGAGSSAPITAPPPATNP